MSEPVGGDEGTDVEVRTSVERETPDVSPLVPSESLAHVGPNEVANPITGELIRVDDPRECAIAIAELRDLEDRIKEVKRVLGATLVDEARKQGVKGTLRVPGADVTISRRKTIEWDMEQLAQLRDAGLPEERWGELVRTTVEEKVNANVAKQLAGANEAYAVIIEVARRDFEGEPYVSDVKRSGE